MESVWRGKILKQFMGRPEGHYCDAHSSIEKVLKCDGGMEQI